MHVRERAERRPWLMVVGAILSAGALALPFYLSPPAGAAFEPIATQPLHGLGELAVADAQRWATRSVTAEGVEVTADGGANWTTVAPPVPDGDTLAVGAVTDGTFRMVVTSQSSGQQTLHVYKLTATGATTEIAGPEAIEPLILQAAVDADGMTWIVSPVPGAQPTLWVMSPEGGDLAEIPIPGSEAREIRRTAFGLRLVVLDQPTTLRVAGGTLIPAERGVVELADGALWLGDQVSWDAGGHWAKSGLDAQVVPRAPAAGGAPRLLTIGPTSRIAQRHSPWLFWGTGLTAPRPNDDLGPLVDAGDALVSAGGDGRIYVHRGPLPPAPASIGVLAPDAVAMIDRANVFRADAGIPPLIGDALIGQAARNHSIYTALNPAPASLDAHFETPGRPGFTGESPGDRCQAVGATCGGEVMFGDGVSDPVGGWLATPFHRFLPGSPLQGTVGAAQVNDGWAVMNAGERFGALVGPFGYPNGRWRGGSGFAGEIPDPVEQCNADGHPISYPVGIAVSFYVPATTVVVDETAAPTIEGIEVRRNGGPPLAGCPLGANPTHFVLDDPLVPGSTYAARGRWLAGAGLVVTHDWSFTYRPESPVSTRGDRIRPTLSPLSLSPRRFRVAPAARRGPQVGAPRRKARSAARKGPRRKRRAPAGTRVRFSASERGRLDFMVQRRTSGRVRKAGRRARCVAQTRQLIRRRAKRCARYEWVGASTYKMRVSGRQSFRFAGRVRRGWLAPGRYRMRAQAIDKAGNASPPRLARFRIVRR